LFEGKKSVLIEGASGGGKSALLANWLVQRRSEQASELIFEHYLAASADASDPEQLVRRLIEFIRRGIGSQEDIPGDPQQLFDSLVSWLAQASAYAEKKGTRFIIAIDAINGLRRLRDLRWWPQDIPPHVHFIVSCLPGEVQVALNRKGNWFSIVVEPLQPVDCEILLVAYLQRYNKTLPDDLKQRALAHPLSGNPLFLRTLAEELRLFGVHEELASRLDGYLASRSVQDLFICVLERIEENFPPATVQKTMSSVWSSRSGLREEEIMGLCDLVQATWAPLRSALDEMLRDSMGQIGFAHDFIKQAVQVRYMPHEHAQRDVHLSLANWFAKREPDARRAHEEPYQLHKAEQWSLLRDCLLNAQMFGAINKHAGVQELLGYWLLLKKTLGFEFESSYESVWCTWKEHDSDVDFLQSAIWMQRFLAYAGCTGNFALDVSHLGLSLSREKNGEAHKETLELMNRMAILLKSRGDYTQAEAMYLHTISLLEKTGRKGESRLAMVLVNFAELTRMRGFLEQAEGLARQALALQEKVKGPWHMSTWLAINNLASVLKSRGTYKEAVELHTRALRIVRRRRGFEHKDTSISLNNLGSLFQTLGQKVEAEKAFRSALKIREKLLGQDHIMTITVRNNLALQLKLIGQLDEAEILYRKVFTALEHQLTPGHAYLGTCAHNLGSLLFEKGNLTEAEAYFNQALAIRQSKLGIDHADVATTLNLQARLRQAQGLSNEALALRVQALDILQNKLGPKHREALNTLEQLAKLQENLSQFQAAEESLQQLMELRRRDTAGTQCKAWARSRELLASFYERNGRAQESAALRANGDDK